MNHIRDTNGEIISSSKNLAGIRRYVSSHLIKILDISKVGQFEGQLSILFEDKSSYQTNFASFEVLRNFVRRWRNVYGAPLRVNGVDCGNVEYKNEALKST